MSNNSNQFKMTKKQTKRFATYLLFFLIVLTTLTLVRLMCCLSRRHESWWFFDFVNDEKDDTTTTVAPLTTTMAPGGDLERTTTVAPLTTTVAPTNVFGTFLLNNDELFETEGDGTTRCNPANENECVVDNSAGTGQHFIISKSSYSGGFTVSCDMKTDGADVVLFMVPKSVYDTNIGLDYETGILYGPGNWADRARSVLSMFGVEIGGTLYTADLLYHRYKLTFDGDNTIDFAVFNSEGTRKHYGTESFYGTSDSTEFHVGVMVYGQTTGHFKNFEITTS